jgi:hypothetical protein
MDFKKVTDDLFRRTDHAELAAALGVSVASIRQARLNPSAKAYRAPPKDWENTVIRLAEERVWHYRQLIDRIRSSKREG